MRGIPAFTCLFLLSLPTFGAVLSPEYQQCVVATDTNDGWAQCSDQEIERQEGRLEAVWNETFTLMKKIAPKSAEMLLDEQRAWVKYKDGACNFYGSGDFVREGQVISLGRCKAQNIADRIEALSQLAKELHSE